jgi:hemerythrin superfamily protein
LLLPWTKGSSAPFSSRLFEEIIMAARASQTYGKVAAGVAAGLAVGLAAGKARKLAVQGLEAAAGDWFDVLKAEHRAVDALFAKLEKTTKAQPAKRTVLFSKIKLALAKHAFQEENVIYPAVRKSDSSGAAAKLHADHFEIKALLSEGEQAPKGEASFMTAMEKLRSIVSEHVKEEEQRIFPALREKLDAKANAKLTALMHKEGIKLA